MSSTGYATTNWKTRRCSHGKSGKSKAAKYKLICFIEDKYIKWLCMIYNYEKFWDNEKRLHFLQKFVWWYTFTLNEISFPIVTVIVYIWPWNLSSFVICHRNKYWHFPSPRNIGHESTAWIYCNPYLPLPFATRYPSPFPKFVQAVLSVLEYNLVGWFCWFTSL